MIAREKGGMGACSFRSLEPGVALQSAAGHDVPIELPVLRQSGQALDESAAGPEGLHHGSAGLKAEVMIRILLYQMPDRKKKPAALEVFGCRRVLDLLFNVPPAPYFGYAAG